MTGLRPGPLDLRGGPATDPRVGARGRLPSVTSSDEPPAALRTDEAVRRLADQLHHAVDRVVDDWIAAANRTPEAAPRAGRPFARPVTAPPVRMEQLARTPEPTADLDDLVDLLVPRLIEKLVPALRDALRDDA